MRYSDISYLNNVIIKSQGWHSGHPERRLLVRLSWRGQGRVLFGILVIGDFIDLWGECERDCLYILALLADDLFIS